MTLTDVHSLCSHPFRIGEQIAQNGTVGNIKNMFAVFAGMDKEIISSDTPPYRDKR